MTLRYGKRQASVYPDGRINEDETRKAQDAMQEVFDDDLNTFIDKNGRLINGGILTDNSELHNGD